MGNTESNNANASLIEAAKKGETERALQLLWSQNAKIDIRDDKGNTPLMWACALGHKETAEALLKAGANVERRDTDGYTSLHWAVIEKHLPIVKTLITNFKADINARNYKRETPLHKASFYGLIDIATLLVNNGAELTAMDEEQRTPLDRARIETMKKYLTSAPNAAMPGAPLSEQKQEESQTKGAMVGKDSDSKQSDNDEIAKRQTMRNEVRKWLSDLSLSEYAEDFIQNGYDRLDAVLQLTVDDLKMLSVKLGHIKIIINAIQENRSDQPKPMSSAVDHEEMPKEGGPPGVEEPNEEGIAGVATNS